MTGCDFASKIVWKIQSTSRYIQNLIKHTKSPLCRHQARHFQCFWIKQTMFPTIHHMNVNPLFDAPIEVIKTPPNMHHLMLWAVWVFIDILPPKADRNKLHFFTHTRREWPNKKMLHAWVNEWVNTKNRLWSVVVYTVRVVRTHKYAWNNTGSCSASAKCPLLSLCAFDC